jgi:hypothetical protein
MNEYENNKVMADQVEEEDISLWFDVMISSSHVHCS